MEDTHSQIFSRKPMHMKNRTSVTRMALGIDDSDSQRFIPEHGSAAPSIISWKKSSMDYSESEILSRRQPDSLSFERATMCWCAGRIAGSPYAIGFFGYAYYVENRDALNILNASDGIEANAQTTDDGSYPLARPLFIYSDAAHHARRNRRSTPSSTST